MKKSLFDDELRSAIYAITLEIMKDNFPNGVLRGNKYYFLNPFRNDQSIGSCIMSVSGKYQGRWRDYASGDKGDVIDLLAKVHSRTPAEVAKVLRNELMKGK